VACRRTDYEVKWEIPVNIDRKESDMKKSGSILIVLGVMLVCFQQADAKKYEPTWESLREYKEVPK